MSRTFLRQDAQIRNSVSYDDTVAAGSTMESSPTSIESDLNCLRSQVKRAIFADAVGDWFSDIPTIGGVKRGISALGTDLLDLENKKMLFRAQVLTDITVPAAVAATGSITAIAGANLVDGETFTLDDGVNTPTVFEFDSNSSVSGGNVAVTFTSGDADTVVATAIRNAINGVGATLLITASGTGASVVLTHDQTGAVGNHLVTDTVADAGFVISGMSGGAGDVVVLVQANGETPTEVAAVNSGVANGAVVATLSGDVGVWSSAAVSGVNAINPKNLVLIRDGVTDDPILSAGKQVYGLLQAESGVVDGDSFNDTDKQVQISFVRESSTTAHTLEHVPAEDMAGKDIDYSYVRRINLDAVPEQLFLTGAFIDQAASVDVTLDNAVDGQSGPVTQTQNIDWRITDTYTLDFKTSDGARTLLGIIPNAAGDEIEVNVDILDINNAQDADFLNGATFDSGGTPVRVGVTAGYIDTASSDLGVRAGGELYLDDGNQTGSTWAQTAGIKLSDSTTEWDNFETAFGEVSLLNAIYQAYQNAAPRSKTVGVVTSNVSADTNVTGAGGSPNIDAQLGDYSTKTFLTEVDVYLNGQLLRNGADASANNDVYPGDSPANGDLKFEFNLVASPGNPDVITMIIW